jgi:hypothetical protein
MEGMRRRVWSAQLVKKDSGWGITDSFFPLLRRSFGFGHNLCIFRSELFAWLSFADAARLVGARPAAPEHWVSGYSAKL